MQKDQRQNFKEVILYWFKKVTDEYFITADSKSLFKDVKVTCKRMRKKGSVSFLMYISS